METSESGRVFQVSSFELLCGFGHLKQFAFIQKSANKRDGEGLFIFGKPICNNNGGVPRSVSNQEGVSDIGRRNPNI